jgi:hypothetical protein
VTPVAGRPLEAETAAAAQDSEAAAKAVTVAQAKAVWERAAVASATAEAVLVVPEPGAEYPTRSPAEPR